MTTFTKQDLEHIAHLSALKLDEKEVELFVGQIKTVLAYIDQIQHAPLTTETPLQKNSNLFRDDVAIPSDSAAIRALAPVKDDYYFTVPKILDEK